MRKKRLTIDKKRGKECLGGERENESRGSVEERHCDALNVIDKVLEWKGLTVELIEI